MTKRRWISVPFEEKDAVKRIGARWDPKARLWYVPEGFAITPFQQWVSFDWSNPPEVLIFRATSPSGREFRAKVYNVPVRNGLCTDQWELNLGGDDRVATCELIRYVGGFMSENIFHGRDVGLTGLIDHIRAAVVNGEDLLCHKASWSPAMQHAARISWVFKASTSDIADQVFEPSPSLE